MPKGFQLNGQVILVLKESEFQVLQPLGIEVPRAILDGRQPPFNTVKGLKNVSNRGEIPLLQEFSGSSQFIDDWKRVELRALEKGRYHALNAGRQGPHIFKSKRLWGGPPRGILRS